MSERERVGRLDGGRGMDARNVVCCGPKEGPGRGPGPYSFVTCRIYAYAVAFEP